MYKAVVIHMFFSINYGIYYTKIYTSTKKSLTACLNCHQTALCLTLSLATPASPFQEPNIPSLPLPLHLSLHLQTGWKTPLAGGQEVLSLPLQDSLLDPGGLPVSGRGHYVPFARLCTASPDDPVYLGGPCNNCPVQFSTNKSLRGKKISYLLVHSQFTHQTIFSV